MGEVAAILPVMSPADIKVGEPIRTRRYATVYRGTYHGNPVAVKIPLPQYRKRRDIERFLRECNLLMAMRHPNIVPVLGTATLPDDTVVLVKSQVNRSLWDIDVLDGDSTNSRRSQHRTVRILDHCIGVASAVAYLHSRSPPVAHCSINSHNIIIDGNGAPLLTGFDISRELSWDAAVIACHDEIGMGAWLSPECFAADSINCGLSSDIYSLGVLLNELASSKHPFPGWENARIREAVLRHERPALACDDDIPLVLVEIIKAAWDQDPFKRPSAQTVLHRLLSLRYERHQLELSSSAADLVLQKEEGGRLNNFTLPLLPQAVSLRAEPPRPRAVCIRRISLLSLQDNAPSIQCCTATQQYNDGGSSGDVQNAVATLSQCIREVSLRAAAAACHAIFLHARWSEAGRVEVACIGGIPVLISLMSTDIDDATLMIAACKALGSVAMNEDNAVQIAQAHGISVLAAVLRHHSSDLAVAEAACWAMESTMCNDVHARSVASCNGIQVLFAALRAHEDNATVVSAACGALRKVAMDANSAKEIVCAEGIPLILTLLRQHTGDPAVSEAACGALEYLTCMDNARIRCADGITTLVSVLRRHVGNASVSIASCWVLNSLAVDSDNAKEIVHAFGVAPIASVLRLHSLDVAVVESACWALRTVGSKRGILAAEPDAVLIAILPPLVSALRHHAGVASIVEAVCGTLRYIAHTRDIANAIARIRGIDAMVDACSRHCDNTRVTIAACSALGSIAASGNEPVIAACNVGIPCLVTALRHHTENATAVGTACQALRFLAANKSNAEAIVQADVVPSIAAVLRRHSHNPAVSRAACAVLQGVARLTDCAIGIVHGPRAVVLPFDLGVLRGNVHHLTVDGAAAAVLGRVAAIDDGVDAIVAAPSQLTSIDCASDPSDSSSL